MPGLLGMSRDGVAYVVVAALAICLVCSVVVSSAAVYLKPLQTQNKKADRRQNILETAGIMQPDIDINAVFKSRIETRVVELATGDYAENISAEEFDQREASRSPDQGINITRDEDIAGIKRRSKFAEVYLVNNEQGELQTIVLPVHGYGLWSTMYGFIALESDANTIVGLKFYEQGETPGLGAEVENPKWRDLWPGKLVYGPESEPKIRVVKGAVGSNTPDSEYKVDGLSGATITSRGVSNMLEYWMSDRGFQKYLEKVRTQPLPQAG